MEHNDSNKDASLLFARASNNFIKATHHLERAKEALKSARTELAKANSTDEI